MRRPRARRGSCRLQVVRPDRAAQRSLTTVSKFDSEIYLSRSVSPGRLRWRRPCVFDEPCKPFRGFSLPGDIWRSPKAEERGPQQKNAPTKAATVDEISKVCGMSKVQVGQVLEAMGNTIEKHLKSHGSALIPGLAKVVHKHLPARPARMGRNPATGEEIRLKPKPASSTVKVRALKAFKDMA